MTDRTRSFLPALAALALAASANVHAVDDAGLATLVDQRLSGDRTGACLAVAVVEKDTVVRAFRCADPAQAGRIGPDTAFEIGSVSKTMTATLLADLITQGKASLDDPLAAYLPEGTVVPAFEGQPILLRHVVTHTSGLPALPPGVAVANPADPYAAMTPRAVLDSLARVQLSQAPGTDFAYSNFASMLLSHAVAHRSGTDFESLLQRRLFAPLGMQHAHVKAKPDDVRVALGHLPNGTVTPGWNFATDLAGVGGVRATLDDMARYVRGNLDPSATSLGAAFELAQRQVGEQPPMAMNWMLMPVADRTVLVHEGGTGGFSSFVAVDREQRRGVVILSDTSWTTLGGLGSLGMHLVDPAFPLAAPRKLASPPQDLLDGLVGEYQLQGAMAISLRQRDGQLFFEPAGQGEHALSYDDAGDFFPSVVDAVLRPRKTSDGGYAFTWMQGGGAIPAIRRSPGGASASAPARTEAELGAYAGEYTLMPGFVLSVRTRDGRLHAQATGQGEFPLDATDGDTFEAPAFGIRIVFKRDGDGAVASLDLHQGGQVLSGARGR